MNSAILMRASPKYSNLDETNKGLQISSSAPWSPSRTPPPVWTKHVGVPVSLHPRTSPLGHVPEVQGLGLEHLGNLFLHGSKTDSGLIVSSNDVVA